MPNALQITDPNADNPLAQAPSWADAAQSVAGTVSSGGDALGQWLAAQRAKSSQMGLWNDQTGLPTGKGLVSAAQQTGNALLMGTTAPGIRAFHGSPYDFERFDTSRIGTGEGAQAYGHGLYMAENEGVARQYRDVLASRSETNTPEGVAKFWANMQGGHEGGISHLESVLGQIDKYPNSYAPGEADKINQAIQYLKSGGDLKPAGGHMYEVNIGADPEQFLHWDRPISEQPKAIQDMLDQHGIARRENQPYITGQDVHDFLSTKGDYAAGAQRLKDLGIPGIRYLDQGSRNAGGWHITPPDQTVSGKWMVKSNDYNSQGMHFDNEADARAALDQKIGGQTHNYVVFDANTIDILRKYGIAGLGIGLSGAAATNGSQQPPMAQ